MRSRVQRFRVQRLPCFEIIFEYFEFCLGAGVALCTVMIKDWHAIAAFAFIVKNWFSKQDHVKCGDLTPCFTM